MLNYIEFKGEQGAREAGKMRLEGKNYSVADGDVIHFRYNVWVLVLDRDSLLLIVRKFLVVDLLCSDTQIF